jgi:hypothetical protein
MTHAMLRRARRMTPPVNVFERPKMAPFCVDGETR